MAVFGYTGSFKDLIDQLISNAVSTKVNSSTYVAGLANKADAQPTSDALAARPDRTELAATYLALRATPPDPTKVVAYIDTSTVPPVLMGWDGTTWVALGGAAAVIPDGALITDIGDFLVTDLGDYLISA